MSSDTIVLRDIPRDFAYLIVLDGHRAGRAIHLAKETTIGRAGENDICLDDALVSAHHAKIRREDSRYVIYDLASENGTTVDSEKIHQQELQTGNRIAIGEGRFMFKHLRMPGEASHG